MVVGVSLLVVNAARGQTTIPPVFIPFETANQRIFAGRFDDSIKGFFSFLSDGVFLQLFPRINQGFQNFEDEASAAVDELPIPSGSVSVAYEFDPKLETFVRIQRPFAPALALNARTDGRGVFTVGAAYSYVNYKNFDGEDRSDVVFPAPLNATDEVGRPISDQALFQFKLQQSIFSVAFSYGVLDNLDVGILIPVIQEWFRGQMTDRFFAQNPNGSFVPANLFINPDGSFAFRSDNRLPPVRKINLQAYNVPAGDLPLPGFTFNEKTYGVGDIILRSKAFLGSAGAADFGAAVNMSLPTGDEDNLLGVGSVRFEPRFLVSTANDRFALHTNLGVHVDVDEQDRDRFDYSVGGEMLLAPWVTLLVDQIGLLEFSGSGQIRKYEIVPGIKVNPYGSVVVGFNAIVPLNDSGLRTDFTPNGSLEVSTVF
jgi:hypothetical protein